MTIQEKSQRQAARDCLANNEVIEEGKLVAMMVKRFGISEKHAKQGIKNSIHMDAKIHRSVFNGRSYCRLAETKAPVNHMDFGTSPVNLKITREEYIAWRAEKDKPVDAPWKAPKTPLEAHFEKMQEMATRYLMPEPYIDRDGNSSKVAIGSDKPVRDAMFANDILYMLDGPEQRAAQGQAA